MKLSVKNISTLLTFTLGISACGKKEKELTPQQIQAKADSIFQTKLKKLQQQAKEDLDRRMSIEIKPKVDSIRNISREISPPPAIQ